MAAKRDNLGSRTIKAGINYIYNESRVAIASGNDIEQKMNNLKKR